MKLTTTYLNCKKHFDQSKRKTPFHVVVCTFDYLQNPKDKALLDTLVKKGVALAERVNPGAANNGSQKRDFEKIKNNCVAGVVAEHCWMHYLNDESLFERVGETPFQGAAAQIDLRTLKSNQSIEVRSSFPRNGIPFALCHPEKQFDVIGPYANEYKPGEIRKDFYVRALFHLKKTGEQAGSGGKLFPIIEKIMDKIYQDNFEVFLTGGADWAMMIDNAVAVAKNFIPDDEFSVNRLQAASDYRVVPFSRALDAVEIYEMIKALA